MSRTQKKGLRPRHAAYLIIGFWAIAVVVFGMLERLIDPDTFDNVWLGMWWALQTVTTVGYGDVVPASTAGKVVASFLLLGGLVDDRRGDRRDHRAGSSPGPRPSARPRARTRSCASSRRSPGRLEALRSDLDRARETVEWRQ